SLAQVTADPETQHRPNGAADADHHIFHHNVALLSLLCAQDRSAESWLCGPALALFFREPCRRHDSATRFLSGVIICPGAKGTAVKGELLRHYINDTCAHTNVKRARWEKAVSVTWATAASG